MALAAAQMHFPSGNHSSEPSWDESIVPALRQRLQTESQMLTKRLSTHSITSSTAARQAAITASATSKLPRPSGDRQGSISQSSQDRQASSSTTTSPTTTTATGSFTKKRQRTNSTPFAAPGTTGGSSSGSGVENRVSRIPKVSHKSTAGSVSSSVGGYQQAPYRPSALSNSTNLSNTLPSRKTARPGYIEPPSPSFDPRVAAATVGGRGYIPHEEPPFTPNSASTSTEFNYEQSRLMASPSLRGQNSRGSSLRGAAVDSRGSSLKNLHARVMTTGSELDGRMSIDEGNESSDKERAFEHWYRGESARNGGVGELSVGRKEMMDIAKFGYNSNALNQLNAARSGSPSKRSSPLGYGEFGAGGGRRRAGSVDEKRESWIMDETLKNMNDGGRVVDESPLTDLEGDEYTTEGERNYPYPGREGLVIPSVPSPSIGHSRQTSAGGEEQTYVFEDDGDLTLSTTPTALGSLNSSMGNSRTPAKQQANGRSATSPPSAGKTSTGTKSPPSASKGKAKPRAPGGSARQPERAEDPAQGGEETVGAEKIPFRRPPAKGNWDDIVLPAVSKKMGIEGYGLRSERGEILEISEEVRKRMSAIPAPVPGLFGYDASKYKPHRPEEDIQMGDLSVSQPSPPGTPKAKPQSPPPEDVPVVRTSGRESPLAFSHYQAVEKPLEIGKKKKGDQLPQIMVSPPSADGHRKPPPKEDEHKGGCCGCVIM